MAKERASADYKTMNKHYSVPTVINIDFRKCLKLRKK